MTNKCTITFEVTDSGSKMSLDGHLYVESDGRLIAETSHPITTPTLKNMNIGSHDAFKNSSSVYALKHDIEIVLDIIREAQENGSINEISDDSKEGLAINRLNDMLDGVIYPIFIDKISHQYPKLIAEFNKINKNRDYKALEKLSELCNKKESADG